ncbi:3-phosphoshikimate 1-carboxyvinyltransferase [Pycnococcus provasolii]
MPATVLPKAFQGHGRHVYTGRVHARVHHHRARAAASASSVGLDDSLVLDPITLISGNVQLPGSKSLSNRALLLASMSKGTTTLVNLLDSDDIRYNVSALETLGVEFESLDWETGRVVVKGCGGRFQTVARTMRLSTCFSETQERR